MAYLAKKLTMPNGQEYEFVGRSWFASCTAAAGTQTKTADVSGFTSENLISGARVTVYFQYRNSYNGTPKLNVSGTGAKDIVLLTSGASAKQYEWPAYSVLDFVYYNNTWVLMGHYRADGTYPGIVRLSDSYISNETDRAATPYAVHEVKKIAAIFGASGDQTVLWHGNDLTGTDYVRTVINTTTPAAASWNDDTCFLSGISSTDMAWIQSCRGTPRYIRITYDDTFFIGKFPVEWAEETALDHFYFPTNTTTPKIGEVLISEDSVEFAVNDVSYVGAHPLKIEVFCLNSVGLVTNLSLPTKVSDLTNDAGYLTLADLPIYNGGVS